MALSSCVRVARPQAMPIVSRRSAVCVRAAAAGDAADAKTNLVGKAKLVEVIAKEADLTKVQAAKAFDAMIGGVEAALLNGERVTLSGFGSFEVRDRNARNCRNPRTGEQIVVPASKAPAFKASVSLKERVKEGKAAAPKPAEVAEAVEPAKAVKAAEPAKATKRAAAKPEAPEAPAAPKKAAPKKK